jgi:hypothetical protein
MDNNNKSEFVIISINNQKLKKKNPTNNINKHVNKYNSKNKSYYESQYQYNTFNCKYISNSDIYLEK